jgi:DNA-binding SARP family transcriptional activator/tetratricopeptide (TPR) repeat protein
MEFLLLGPVEIRAGDRNLEIGHARQRAVLAVLLLDLGRVVSADRLIDRVWGETAPASVRNVLYGYVARIRAALSGIAEDGVTFRRGQGGYLLQADPGLVDVHRFRDLARQAKAAGDRAEELLREALSCWRGPALAGLDSPWLNAMRHTLELERHAAQLDLNDIRLRQGQHAVLVAELSSYALTAPADERLISQLMLALYRSGRQVDALRWYDQTRRHLADELGADPGAALRDLHEQILRADPALTAPAGIGHQAQKAALTRPVPRQLPAAVADFTGRATELAVLTEMLDQAGAGGPGTVVISAIGGTAGVGKTALALHWAHQAANRFPDGQLHVNLRGFDPSGTQAEPHAVIRGFLDALGVPPGRIAADPVAQTGLYRSLLADKRMLIVLDNARDEQQVRPLLPASAGSLVIVTSRSQLGGLAAANGARLLSLDVLTRAEAVHLLTARIGTVRVAAEPDAVDQIAELCAYLPLALAVAAARAAARPHIPLATLAAELAGTTGRLDALDAGDPASSVRAVLSWSYQSLSDLAARMFRLLGLHPGPDISVPAAASLAGTDEADARRLLSELTRASLLSEHRPGRYAFHDLLRAYAADQAGAAEDQQARHEATGRILDHYLHTAIAAALLINPSRDPVSLPPPRPAVMPERLADYQQALAWMKAELLVLFAATALADSSGFDSHAWQIPWTMADLLYWGVRWRDLATVQGTAVAAAARLSDLAGQATSLSILGQACARLGHHDQALAHNTAALKLYQQLGDPHGEGQVHMSLGRLAESQERYADALGHSQQALRLFQAQGDRVREAMAINNVGWYHALLGDYQQARVICQQALSLSMELGQWHDEANAWDSLGYAEHQLGNHAEAIDCYERALSIFREFGSRFDQAETLTRLGDTRHARGDLPQARLAWQQALDILDKLDHSLADQVRGKLASTADRGPKLRGRTDEVLRLAARRDGT